MKDGPTPSGQTYCLDCHLVHTRIERGQCHFPGLAIPLAPYPMTCRQQPDILGDHRGTISVENPHGSCLLLVGGNGVVQVNTQVGPRPSSPPPRAAADSGLRP